VISQF